jgi:hypothetical protein
MSFSSGHWHRHRSWRRRLRQARHNWIRRQGQVCVTNATYRSLSRSRDCVKSVSPLLFLTVRREGVVCDDSCQYAFNGVCDDGSEGELDQYYEQYGYYQSDDLGGYGGSDGTEGERDPAGGSYAEVRTDSIDAHALTERLS